MSVDNSGYINVVFNGRLLRGGFAEVDHPDGETTMLRYAGISSDGQWLKFTAVDAMTPGYPERDMQTTVEDLDY